jgi:lipopolysaccharide export system protein LptC
MTTVTRPPAKPAPPANKHDTTAGVVWHPRDVSVERSVGQYSRFVGRMKIALPAVASVILLLVLLWPQLKRENANLKVAVKSVGQATSDTLSMMNARYYGVDDEGRPFFIRAVTARQRPDDNNLYDLTSPHGELTMSDGNVVTLEATSGIYDRAAQVLDLTGKVHMEDQKGRVFDTTQAHVLVKDKIATGDAPVTGHDSFGNIVAAGFTMHDDEKDIDFVGPVKLVVNRHKGDDAASAAPPPSAGPAPTTGVKQ